MKRRTIAIVAFVGAVIAINTGTVLILRHHAQQTASQRATSAATATSTADTRTADQRAEDSFIDTTAAHLCNVHSTVYDDPKALADAYESVPAYPGLTEAQVKALRERLKTDASLTARLTKQLKTACRPGGH